MSECELSEASSAPEPASAVVAARAGLVDLKSAPLQVFAIKPGDRGPGFGTVGHLHKSESPRIPSEFVCDDFDRCDLPEGFKSLSQIFFSGLSR